MVCISILVFSLYQIVVGLISETISVPLKGHTEAIVALGDSPFEFFLCLFVWLIFAFNSGYLAHHIYHRKTIAKNEVSGA